jgi:hypothetical protein
MRVGRNTSPVAWLCVCMGFALPGCQEMRSPLAVPTPSDAGTAAARFDLTTAGTFVGQVTWNGMVPPIDPISLPANPLGSDVLRQRQVRPNPNAPRIDATTNGVGNAVVFLRGVDVQAAKPWDLPAVRVEQRDGAFHILQATLDSAYGFVRRGDSVVLVSCDEVFHALHASGAAFFSYAFPDAGQPLARCLDSKGLVELASAAGYPWMRAYLFVDEHPYYARTDPQGRFALSHVPPGQYEIVCWMPNWHKARHERDPESGVVTRLFFRPPVELVQSINLGPRASETVHFTLSAEMFSSDVLSVSR